MNAYYSPPLYQLSYREWCHVMGTYCLSILTWDLSYLNDETPFKTVTSPVGLEPTASGLEVRRAIHCATGTTKLEELLDTFVIREQESGRGGCRPGYGIQD